MRTIASRTFRVVSFASASAVVCASAACRSSPLDAGDGGMTYFGSTGTDSGASDAAALPIEISDTGAGDLPGAGDGSTGDAALDAGSTTTNDASYPPIDASALKPCATRGTGSFAVAGATCFNFTPADTGASPSGENAAVPHYAIRPATAPSTLMLFFIGSGGKPSGAVRPDPAMNVYGAAVTDGRAVLGLSYSNVESLGMLCMRNDACYFPSRESIILGEPETGSAITVPHDQSIVDRTARALRYLAAGDPSGGWGSFLTTLDPNADAKSAIVWSKIIAAGHSQGGGHAAAIGKLFPVLRVVQFSSTCDANADDMAVSWTHGAAGPWASDPTLFYGLAATSTPDANGAADTTCPYHTLNWTNLGMKKNHRNNAAEICGATGDTHGASIQCTDNYPTWVTLFQ